MLIVVVVDGVVDWFCCREGVDDDVELIGLLIYLVLKCVDDLVYGVGLWYGVVCECNIGVFKL